MKKFHKTDGGDPAEVQEDLKNAGAAPEAAENAAAPEPGPAENAAEKAAEAEPADPAAKLAAEFASLQEKYVYLQAEYQNYRKRVARDLADTRVNAVASTLTPFLNVFDFLSMAENAAEKSDNIESIRQGLKMIIQQFFKTFDELGVKKFDSVGAKFDPARQDAVADESSDTVPEGVVIREWSAGFMLGERVLRPARVVVSSGAAKAEKSEESPEAAADGKGE